ncbi:uncharacterized protein TRUGW13939_00846 [Talaromyces rugulosus]|uniref:Uncharacterized protein n=1 Tax=Talaromyces rugulosus TaxID=121627 RepID=A0A7H8QIN6_TALRU|nr:uncharacterized protein TRUGW13939_00846 [Talaromyces rugulosus]QKX53766.1 hypothetical protein TRUGW13939_00846 [Talaromyces rugulosus]
MALGVQSQRSYAQVVGSPPKHQPWQAIFRIENIQTPPPQPRGLQQVSGYLTEHVYPAPGGLIFQDPSKRMGNQDGLDSFDRLFREMDEMKQQLRAMGEDNRQTKKNFLDMRAWELQQAARAAAQPQRYWLPVGVRAERNRFVHGGNVALDIQAIESLHDMNQRAGATAGFEVFYGRTLAEVGPRFHDVPDAVVSAFNFRGDLTRLEVWKYHPGKEESVRLCDQIITAWLNGVGNPALDPQIGKMYDRLMQIMPV